MKRANSRVQMARLGLAGVSLAIVIALSAVPINAAIVVSTGDVYALDPDAQSYGAVRFKDFANAKDGYRSAGNLYLQDSSSTLGSNTGLDGRARVMSGTDNGPLWQEGSQPFSFEYRPVDGGTDLILSTAGYLSSGAAMTTPLSRIINDPTKPVNFISFYILNRTTASGDITLSLTDLDGNALTPSAVTISPLTSGNWYLADSNLLANGFILSGTISLGNPRDAGETDKIDIAFGNAIPEPATMSLLALGGIATLIRRRRKA
jgi:hypothetical protein